MKNYEIFKEIPKGQKLSQKASMGAFFSFYLFFVHSFIFRFISYHGPFGVQRLSLYTTRGEAPSCGGWMDGWVGGDILPLLIFFIF